MNNGLSLLNHDIIYEIIKNLDYKSSKTFLLSCKKIYNIYLTHDIYYNTLFIYQIFKHFHLKTYKIQDYITSNQDEKYKCYLCINKIYNHFYLHKFSSIIDFIIFLIENSSNNKNTHLLTFNILLDFCKFYYIKPLLSNSVLNRNNISINDMKYIITFCSIDQLKIILNKYTIHSSIISYSIQEIIDIHIKCKTVNTVNKINLLINYLFYKYCFNNKFSQIDDLYFHKILSNLIKYQFNNYFNYIFLKVDKYKNDLEYNILLNESIEYDNITAFEILLNHFKIKNNIILDTDFINLNINPNSIEIICKKGNLKFLIYIINNILHFRINYTVYIASIINGLKFHINFNCIKNEFRKNFLNYFENNNYISNENFLLIQNLF